MGSTRLSDAELRAWQALLHASQDVIRTLDRELQDEHDLTLASYDVLLRLARVPSRTLRMTDLAERVLLSPSGITRLVDRLVERGFVTRSPDPDDGRVALASLTDAGLGALRNASRTHLRGVRDHFTGKLRAEQLRTLADTLERVTGPHAPH